jgi:deazaflavin-dependent oxidoreductase (nitroreductase family)
MAVMTNPVALILRTRWAVRAPIALFRARLGFLFAGRLLLLEHVGRKSGAPRYVVLEVIGRHDRDVYVASGFGERAQWLRNLRATPECRVSIGRLRSVPASATVLEEATGQAILREYAGQHPRAWKRLRQAMAELQETESPVIPIVRLRLSA